MALEMINQWFGIEQMGTRFLVRDLAGTHANCATRAESLAWIEAHMRFLDSLDADEPEATADEYRDAR